MGKADYYAKLEKAWSRVAGLSDAISMLSWDSHTLMPSGAGEARAEQLAVLSVLRQEEMSSSFVSDLIHLVDEKELNLWQRANLREIKRLHDHASSLSPAIVEAHSRARNHCEAVWRTARDESRFDLIIEPLSNLLVITREISLSKAEILKKEPYDTLLDEYEPGGSAAHIDTIFQKIEPALTDLLPEVIEYQKNFEFDFSKEPIGIERQKNLGLKVMKQQGFKFTNGRLDISIHPFSGGVPDDVRITTRYDELDWSRSLMGVIHETGHALYEQGLPVEWRGQPVGSARGMVLHESQSLALEMQICRSKEFFSYLASLIATEFEVEGAEWSPKSLYRKAIRVSPNFIRVDADELSYSLHIILRYRLERAMLAGDLVVSELPLAWNDGFEKSFGIRPTNNREGCLQDIHWYDGAFGYFPTYSLGAMTAAQLFATLSQDLPQISTDILEGKFGRIIGWLRDNVHRWGSYHSTETLLTEVTGEPLRPEFFISHLKRRYLTTDLT
ncbi:MAG: carboxypeptidase M32 [Rhodospirillaceae bacterium]|nr:carboxypeptidase M32 [Rhodospirillaceae bacterium]|tara:strand:- start:50 stop:1552 length:1503 start_codon:yes stop_codon:yes gene_type:complete